MATFSEVAAVERAQFRAQEPPPSAAAQPREGAARIAAEVESTKPTVGLAFSGGGIPSATFNLGILQGLSAANLLTHIDYLSTVSGGGYIGAWLASWIKRTPGGVPAVQNELGHFQPTPTAKGFVAEPEQVSFLRDYSNYLTPRLGLFGADTWAAIATYLRNVLLNQIILIAFLGAIVFLPWCVLRSFHWLSHHALKETTQSLDRAWIAAICAGICLLIAICWASIQTGRCSFTDKAAPRSAGQNFVLSLSVLPVFASAIFTMLALWLAPNAALSNWSVFCWILIGAFAYGISHAIGVVLRSAAVRAAGQRGATLTTDQWLFIPGTAFVAAALAGLLLEFTNEHIVQTWKSWPNGFMHALAWGPGLFVLIYLLAGTLHIGFLKILIQNEEQEWWGRMAGLVMIVTIGWTALFGLTFFVPWLLVVCGTWLKTKTILGLTWAGTTLFGVLAGKSSYTSGKKSGGYGTLDIVAAVSPYVFVAGLFVLLSWGAFWLAERQIQRDTKIPPIAAST